MSDKRIKIEYRDGTNPVPILHFSIPSEHLLIELIRTFRKLAESPAVINLAKATFVELQNVRDIELVCLGENKEPTRKLQPDKDRQFFRWIHDSDGWIWIAELAEGLTSGGEQNFDYGENNDVGIDASFISE
jgi:hypothetical protein